MFLCHQTKTARFRETSCITKAEAWTVPTQKKKTIKNKNESENWHYVLISSKTPSDSTNGNPKSERETTCSPNFSSENEPQKIQEVFCQVVA